MSGSMSLIWMIAIGLTAVMIGIHVIIFLVIRRLARSSKPPVAPETTATGKRYFEVSVQRVCGEFVCGRVSAEFYEYWRDRDGLEEHIRNLDDPELCDAGSPSPLTDGSTCEGWYALDDVAHLNNAVIQGNYLHVDEVRPDEDAHSGFAPMPDGFSEVFDLEGQSETLKASLFRNERQILIECEVDAPENPVIMMKSIEKGAQTISYIETDGPFDLSRLSMDIWEFDGDDVIYCLRYDGIELENHPDSSDGRAFYAYVGDLESDEPSDDDT